MCQFRSEWRLSFRQLFPSNRASFTITMMNAVSTRTTQPFDTYTPWCISFQYPVDCGLLGSLWSAVVGSLLLWAQVTGNILFRLREQTEEDQTASALKRNDSTLPSGPSNVLQSEDHPQHNWGWLTGSPVRVCVCVFHPLTSCLEWFFNPWNEGTASILHWNIWK